MFRRFVRSLKNFSQRSSASIKRAFIAFLLMRLGLSFWFWLIKTLGLLETTSGTPELHGVEIAGGRFVETWINIWLRWDSVHYLRIARYGYGIDERSVFFPFYPLLGRIVGWLFGGDAWLGLLVVSNVAALLSLYLLDRWMASIGRQEQAPWVLTALVLFPTAFFLVSGYPHSLLLVLILLGIWSMTNGRLSLAFLFGLAAGLTHSTALPLSLAYAFWRNSRRSFGRFLAATGPPLGVLAFFAWRISKGLPVYAELQWSIWGRGWIAPWTALFQGQQELGWTILLMRAWPNFLVAALSIAAVFWSAKNLTIAHTLYQAGLVLFLLLTGTKHTLLTGFGRYALAGYPVFAMIPALLNSGRRRLFILSISGMIQLYLSGLFVLWAFIG